MKYYLEEIRYWIADKLFTKDLDDAFNMGIREGQRRIKVTLLARITTLQEAGVKNQQAGLKVIEQIIREEI